MGRSKFIIALVAFALVGCGKSDIKVDEKATSDFTAKRDAENALMMKAYNDNAPPYDKLPPVPVSSVCNDDKDTCESNTLEIVKAWPLAWKGDYQGQRNVAYMQSNLNGGVVYNQIQGCAWRIVIQASGHIEFNSGDQMNYDTECSKISDSEYASAKQVAAEIYKKIKGEKLPVIPSPKSK